MLESLPTRFQQHPYNMDEEEEASAERRRHHRRRLHYQGLIRSAKFVFGALMLMQISAPKNGGVAQQVGVGNTVLPPPPSPPSTFRPPPPVRGYDTAGHGYDLPPPPPAHHQHHQHQHQQHSQHSQYEQGGGGGDAAHPRSGARAPNGVILGAGIGVGMPGGARLGGRVGGIGTGVGSIGGIGAGVNPGINPIHRGGVDHAGYGGATGSKVSAIGVLHRHPIGIERGRMVQGDDDDMGDDDDDDGALGLDDDDDEERCRGACSNKEFECSSNCKCILIEQRCDGDADCLHGEDEADCRPAPARSPCLESEGRLRCPKSAMCILVEWLCDGEDDCGDFSDETHCGVSPNCTADQFECNNGLCVHRSWLCDDDNDCKDNSDEINCTRAECTENEFKCADGKCVSRTWRCDKEKDCDDGSDELDCPVTPPTCAGGEFQCANRKCIRAAFKCDRDNDCEDWSDEDGCPIVNRKCLPEEFKCLDGKCLLPKWRCDRERDCDGGEDEENCGPNQARACSKDEHTCQDGKCILSTWVCDGVPDCASGDDETKCDVSCEIGQFMCKSHSNNTLSSAFRTCVNRKHVCDGQKDCPLGDDEDNCPTKHACEYDSKCEQICVTTSAGKPACQCNPGYILGADGYSCKDIDECMYVQDPVCSQTCSNTIGSFTCGCMTGYVLRPDLRTCKAMGASPTLLFTNRAEVRQVSLNSEKYTSILKGLHNAVALDYHYERKLLFWAEVMLDSIRVSNVNGTNITDVIKWGLSSPAGVAVDWIHDLLFWTDSGTTRVEVATLNGRHRAVIAACDLDKPRAIAVHPGDAIVFWTDWGPNPKIERSDMDGSSRKSIITESIFWPNGLTLDYTTSRIYWADAKHHVIESAQFDGSDRKKVVSKGLPHPYSLTLFENAIYWTDWHTKSISTVNKKTGVGFQTVHSGLSSPMDIHSFHPQRQPPYNNHCGNNNGGCSHMCLPNRASYTCHCPLGNSLGSDRRTCEDTSDKLLLFARRQEIRIRHLEAEKPETNIDMVIPLNGIKSAFSLAWDQESKSIFWSDVEKSSINKASLNGSNQTEVISTSLGSPTGLAYDWITGKLYWVDEGTKRLETSNADGSMRAVLLWDQLDKPRDIVLDPLGGMMFWTDWGEPPSINSAHMDGAVRKAIVTDVKKPLGLAIDYARSRIYWVDSELKRIEHCRFDGKDRQVVVADGLIEPNGLDVYGDEIFWTDLQMKAIQTANKITGKGNRTILSNSFPLNDVQVFHKERKMSVNRCALKNGGCSHLCLLKPNGYSCKCPIGVKIGEDRRTCAEGPTNFLIFAHRIDIRQISLDVPYVIDVVLPLPRLKSALAVDVDRKTGEVYWTDTAEDVIHKATPDGKKLSVVMRHELHTVDGIVIDSTGRKIYWTDAGRNSIEVAELDGSNRKLLVWKDLDAPRAIALHYNYGLMFWSDWGKPAKIEQADMDGQNRKVVVSTNLVWPNGLAVDRPAKRLYWNDAKRMTIESSDFNGNDRRTILQDVPYPYGLVVVGSHVYWTDWKTEALHRADKKTGGEMTIIRGKLEGLMDVRSIQTDNIAENACGANNGRCSHLCLRAPGGYSCACPTGVGFAPDTNNTRCQPHPNNFLVFATRSTLARISLDASPPVMWDVTLPIAGIENAITVDFSWRKKLLFYSDVNANRIRSVSMNDDDTESHTVVERGLETPNGLAVDWIADNIYWTDNDHKVLEVARLDGGSRKCVIVDGLDEPRAVAVFPRKGYVYWTDWGEVPRIERAMLDGSSRRIVISTGLGFPNGLAIDYKAKRLYWADALKDRIETADLHGGNRVQLVPEATHPFGLTQFGDHIYWTDWFKKSVMRADKTTGKNVIAIKTDLEVVMEIKAVSAERQKGWNPCAENNGECSHLCLFVGDGYVCACPDEPDGRPCSTTPARKVPLVRPGSDVAPDEYDQEKEYDDLNGSYNASGGHVKPPLRKDQYMPMPFVFVTMGVIVVLMVVLIVGFYFLMGKKQQSGKDEFDARGNKRVISFPNPNYNCNNPGSVGGPGGGGDRRRTNRFQIFKYDRAQDRVTNVYSPEGTSLIPAASHTPSSTRCTVTPDSHPSPQHDGCFDATSLNAVG